MTATAIGQATGMTEGSTVYLKPNKTQMEESTCSKSTNEVAAAATQQNRLELRDEL